MLKYTFLLTISHCSQHQLRSIKHGVPVSVHQKTREKEELKRRIDKGLDFSYTFRKRIVFVKSCLKTWQLSLPGSSWVSSSYIFLLSLSKNWRASRDENKLDNHAATKTDSDSFHHFLIHCRWCKWVFVGWQVTSLVHNSDWRNLMPVYSPVSQQLHMAITHCCATYKILWRNAKSCPFTPIEMMTGAPESQ